MKTNESKTLIVPKGTTVKPAVEEFLRQRQIELVYEEPDQAPAKQASTGQKKYGHNTTDENQKATFYGPDGEALDHKPETMTHLKGRKLVHKDHPIIDLRGKLDSLTAAIIDAQVLGGREKNWVFVDELQEILGFTRRLLSYEYRGQEVEEFNLLGFDAFALRERSHDPQKFFGHPHMLTTYKMGPLCSALNRLRALAREVELTAVRAFKANPRDDIVRALNRLSSLFYILMFKYLPEGFIPESSGI